MATLNALNQRFLQRLQDSVPENLDRYKEDDAWLENWAGDAAWELATNCDVAHPIKLILPADDCLYDVENAVRLHKALPSLTPVQAQDPRLWARLTHIELWQYMRKRWPIERYEKREVAIGRIRERYFVTQRQSRALVRNGAARLWWAAKLTFDPERTNAYELTGVLMQSLDVAKNLLERNFGRAPRITRGFLDFVLRNKELCLESGNTSRNVVRHLSKALNLHGGICVLDCMGRRELDGFLRAETEKAVASIASGGAASEADDDED